MITVNDNWVINVDGMNYAVCRNKPRIEKKTGKVGYIAEAYFSTLGNAIEYIIKQSATDKLTVTDTDLKGAISTIRTTQEEIAEIIKQAIPDAKTYFS